MSEHLDVLIVGAGLSGIDAAVRLAERCPGKSMALVERRERPGGTWDLFAYPGVRSDSDVATLGFPFHPWCSDRAITSGPEILEYILGTARRTGVMDRIRTGRAVTSADWDGARWRVSLDGPEGPETLTCGFLYMATGYYDYDHAHVPDFDGADSFQGPLVVPQFWPRDLDWYGKRIVVVGSGATAVTLVPALAERAHVTMLQRSPSYVVAMPSSDPWARRLQRVLPPTWAHHLTRTKNVTLGMAAYQLARRRPDWMRRFLMGKVAERLPRGFDVERHFGPGYAPWDQRICATPDGAFFDALSDGSARIITDTIDRLTPKGIALTSGNHLDADIIVAATGLKVRLFGGAAITVAGRDVDPASRMTYKGAMLEGVPNLAMGFGYTNASWTLKCDLIARFVCRLINHMDRRGLTVVTPVAPEGIEHRPFVGLTSSYVERARHLTPVQGTKAPWRVHQNYLRDVIGFGYAPLNDGALRFTRS